MSNDERDDEEESTIDNSSEVNNSAKDTTIRDKLKEFTEGLEDSLRFCIVNMKSNSNFVSLVS